jgi:pSer/pThr/pTyr-binding forkhead associated (FHA) protein
MAADPAQASIAPRDGLAIEVSAGPAAGARIPVIAPGLTFGRQEPSPGDLGGDPELSRKHARVVPFPDGLVVRDLGSTNGTFVNGTRVTEPTVVRPGDVLGLGTSRLSVVGPPDDRTRVRSVLATGGASAAPESASARPEQAALQPLQEPIAAPLLNELANPAAPHDVRPGLRVASGPRPHEELPLAGPVVLGRDAGLESALARDPEIEPQHARISPLADGRLLVEDLGSQGGTWVGGARIPAPTIVENGAFIRLGATTLEVVEHHLPGENLVMSGIREVSRMVAIRAPVPREAVLAVFAMTLGWALALDLLVRTIALEVLDLPHNLETLKLVSILPGAILPVVANTVGFYKAFGRPSERSLKQYMIPTILVPTVITAISIARLNHRGALDILATILVIVVPVVINATMMLRLRRKVALAAASGARPAGAASGPGPAAPAAMGSGER